MRPIDADALETRFDDRDAFYLTTQIKKEIRNAPTITPDEVRGVGEWEEVRDRGGYLTPGGTPIVRCSACGGAEHLSGVEFPETFRFCPSCGARMKGSESEHTMDEFMYGQEMGNPVDGSL